MRIFSMAEPATSTVSGLAIYKLAMYLGGATFASLVVMIMTRPRTSAEWTVALVSTVICSCCGGSAVVMYFDLQRWSQSWDGLMALFGLCFVCGLPAWVLVRAWFVFAETKRGASLVDIVKELKGLK